MTWPDRGIRIDGSPLSQSSCSIVYDISEKVSTSCIWEDQAGYDSVLFKLTVTTTKMSNNEIDLY